MVQAHFGAGRCLTLPKVHDSDTGARSADGSDDIADDPSSVKPGGIITIEVGAP